MRFASKRRVSHSSIQLEHRARCGYCIADAKVCFSRRLSHETQADIRARGQTHLLSGIYSIHVFLLIFRKQESNTIVHRIATLIQIWRATTPSAKDVGSSTS